MNQARIDIIKTFVSENKSMGINKLAKLINTRSPQMKHYRIDAIENVIKELRGVYVIKSGNRFMHLVPSGTYFHFKSGCKYWYNKAVAEQFLKDYKNSLPKNAVVVLTPAKNIKTLV